LPYRSFPAGFGHGQRSTSPEGSTGYRDQLQDAAALVYLWPERTEGRSCSTPDTVRGGDVLHWWHPPKSRGLRTRFADDLLWLPFVAAYYVGITGDFSILEEPAAFLRARKLEPGEDEAYVLPERSPEVADVYEHCCRALDRSLTRGEHGLPLFGTGDWNDGMNRVGREGRGESVWLGFFLYSVLRRSFPSARRAETRFGWRYRSYREGFGPP
jgi:cyclic beta-1,2-glucan synthetase